jgi:hypothetical protein
VCAPNQTQCASLTQQQTCTAAGAWGTATACTNQTCVGSACTGVCAQGQTECSSTTVQNNCTASGAWGNATTCTNQTCSGTGVGTHCQGVCAPGQTECVDATSQNNCTAAGAWGNPTTCTNQTCVGTGLGSACGGVCAEGAKQCAADNVTLQTCGASGTWGANVTCQYSCQNAACQGPECQLTPTSPIAACTLSTDCCANAATYNALCEGKATDGGACAEGGTPLDCAGSIGPDGGIEVGECPAGQLCCGTTNITGGTVPNCTANSIVSACTTATTCNDNPPSTLGPCPTGSTKIRLCRSNADCKGDTAYPDCCSCGTIGTTKNPVYLCTAAIAKTFGLCSCL